MQVKEVALAGARFWGHLVSFSDRSDVKTERTRQIGILKSLGMSKTAIAWVIEQEAIIVSVLGVVVGVLLTMLAKLAVMRTTSLTIEIEPRWVLIALAVGLLGGTIGALYPALRAARQDAVDALSYE